MAQQVWPGMVKSSDNLINCKQCKSVLRKLPLPEGRKLVPVLSPPPASTADAELIFLV